MSNTRATSIREKSCDVHIGETRQGKDGYFGNPFRLGATVARGGTLDRYRKYFYYRLSMDEKFRKQTGESQGKTSGCFCKPNPCHEDIIKEYLERMEGCTDEIVIEKTYWKGAVCPVREIQVGNDIFRASVKSLCDELVNDMHDGIYEAMKASEEIDGYCTDEELCTLTDDDLYRTRC